MMPWKLLGVGGLALASYGFTSAAVQQRDEKEPAPAALQTDLPRLPLELTLGRTYIYTVENRPLSLPSHLSDSKKEIDGAKEKVAKALEEADLRKVMTPEAAATYYSVRVEESSDTGATLDVTSQYFQRDCGTDDPDRPVGENIPVTTKLVDTAHFKVTVDSNGQIQSLESKKFNGETTAQDHDPAASSSQDKAETNVKAMMSEAIVRRHLECILGSGLHETELKTGAMVATELSLSRSQATACLDELSFAMRFDGISSHANTRLVNFRLLPTDSSKSAVPTRTTCDQPDLGSASFMMDDGLLFELRRRGPQDSQATEKQLDAEDPGSELVIRRIAVNDKR